MESEVIINGTTLSTAQSMTLRVAINSFLTTMVEGALGDDDHGRAMVEGYRSSGLKIQNLIHSEPTDG